MQCYYISEVKVNFYSCFYNHDDAQKLARTGLFLSTYVCVRLTDFVFTSNRHLQSDISDIHAL